jgi:hypothetical protein
MKITIKSQDELHKLPDSDQGNDIRKMLSAPISVGESQYMVEELTYDDGINEQGEAVNFPTLKISAVFLSGSLKANA